jgi:adenylate cyclase
MGPRFGPRATRSDRSRDILRGMSAQYTRAQAAARAGEEHAFVDRLVSLGVIVPDADDLLSKADVRRIELARTLEGAGIEPDTLASGLAAGHLSLGFMDMTSYERFATLADETFRQVSERENVPLDLLMVVREATGGAVPDPDDRIREDELLVVPFITVQLRTGISARSVDRALRVLGESLRRAAETQGAAWRADLMEPMLERGMSVAEVAAASTTEDEAAVDVASDQAVLAIWHAQQAHAWTANVISGFESILTDAGMIRKVTRPPAICFLDITGYTRLTSERGDVAAADLAEDLNRLVTRTSVNHGGKPIKWLGDGVMVHFRDPGEGVLAALDMIDGVREVGLPPAHVGLHAGPVLFQEGDYFGRTVNLASRIADYARPGEVLVTQEVVNESQGSGCRFTEIGPVELKGVSGTVQLHAAQRGRQA